MTRVLPRRTFLKGAGACLALPWLEAMSRGSKVWADDGDAPVKRFFAFYSPNGFNMDHFWPTGAVGNLSATTLEGSSLEGLSAHTQKLLVLKGLDNYAAAHQGDGNGDHARGTATFLTCTHPLKSEDTLFNGPSVDQLLAQNFQNVTQFGSIEAGTDGGGNGGGCDSGYSCAYSRNISWRPSEVAGASAVPMSKEVHPRMLFDRLVGVVDPSATAEEVERRKRRKQSLLDFVLEDATRLKTQLGAADKLKVDQYMTGIREIELRLQNTSEVGCSINVARPLDIPEARVDHVRLMLDVLVMAMQCDLTRVATFMMGNAGNNRAYPELGITEGHHELSHHQHVAATKEKVRQIDLFTIAQWAYLLEGMNAVTVGNGTLLDETTVLLSSECADGNAHRHYDLPVVMAGRVGDLGMGRYVDLSGNSPYNSPIANLFLTILQDFGLATQMFGDDGTAPLSV